MRRGLSLALLLLAGCSIQQLAVNKIGDALAGGGTAYSSDNDPELIGEALPFSLKLMESLLAESPKHRGLLIACSRGFTTYAYGWVSQRADEIESSDVDAATAQRLRARSLYLRARDYGLRALALRDPQFEQLLRSDAKRAMTLMRRNDVPALYWTAASWGLAISLSKTDPEVVADLPLVEALILRASELDPNYDSGAIETFLISYEAARPMGGADTAARAKAHFTRAVELSRGQLASPYLSYAESVSVQQQNRAEFQEMLQHAMAIDVNAVPEWRLQNILAQRRAAWLLARTSDLFLEEEPSEGGPR
jgi:predicted anti-sigma-YlaC factor YlaD